ALQKSKQKPGPFRAEEAGNGVGETAGKGLPCEERGVTWQNYLEKQLGKFPMPAQTPLCQSLQREVPEVDRLWK
ncbi:unnamed protein product, partial [Gulo gulo]